ncbi:MAG: DUF4434 domain-containing protein, partial [Acidobacteriota bacterium]
MPHFSRKTPLRLLPVFAVLALLGGGLEAAGDSLPVKCSALRPRRGDTVKISLTAIPAGEPVQAVLVRPGEGTSPLALSRVPGRPGEFTAEVGLGAGSPEGLYTVHAWTGADKAPARVGKASFLLGKIIADYPIMSLVDKADPGTDVRAYLETFRKIGGNVIVIHALIDGERAYFPSKIARNSIAPGSAGDIVEGFLSAADRLGFSCHLSVNWDMTHEADYAAFPAQIRGLIRELYALYRHHPSLAGFYCYQEGSGTYLMPLLRDFCGTVKDLDPGLLASCAPYVDDPLLSGYMGTLETLDMIVYQGMVMASFRPDNVKRFPLRRVRDFCSVGIGGKWFQGKIAVTHMELFGYLENKVSPDHGTTSYENIYPQIMSAATAAGSDGVSFFTYHANIHHPLKKHPDIARSRQAVEDGVKAFNVIWDNVSRRPSALMFYLPYADWVVERYADFYLPAFDGFRRLGVPAGFLPFTPRPAESLYPFYPYHANEEVLARLLKDGTVLVLPDVSGFHNTDSDFIKTFVSRGGAVIAFGPQIPMGNTYDRAKLFGGAPVSVAPRARLAVGKAAGRRAAAGAKFRLDGTEQPGWKASTASTAALFEDGSAAVLVNRFGRGLAIAVTLDAASAARLCPDLIRDVIDQALGLSKQALPVDVLGLDENTDMAAAPTADGFTVAVVNPTAGPLEVALKPAGGAPGAARRWTDLVSGAALGAGGPDGALRRTIPPRQFICLEFSRGGPAARSERTGR